MQQKWWLLAMGGVGIALAVLLMGRPDTGDAVTADAQSNSAQANPNPLDFKRPSNQKTVARPDFRDGRVQRMDGVAMGPNPVAARMMAERNTPEGLTAARMSAPWTVIRRELMLSGDEGAKAFGEGLAELVVELRNLRRTPGQASFPDLLEQHNEKLAELKSHPDWTENEVVAQQLVRLDDVIGAYERGEAMAPGGLVPPPPGVAPPPGAVAPGSATPPTQE